MHDDLLAELSHLINSPLAAIRNALYLAASRVNDEQVRGYLEVADLEVINVAKTLRDAREQFGPVPIVRRAQPAVERLARRVAA